MTRRFRWMVLAVALAPLTGCTLTEVTTTPAEDVVVVEALLQRRDDLGFRPTTLTAFLHRTIQGDQGRAAPVPGAEVLVTLESGTVLTLSPAPQGRCVASTPVQGDGSCYEAMPSQARGIQPGERLELSIRTPAGEELEAISFVPGAFDLVTAADGATCRVEPQRPLEVSWTRSAGAWAYVNETELSGLRAALEPLGIPVASEPYNLLGLSVSAEDTTIVLPNEFGIFDRTDLEQPLALELQKGLPAGVRAEVSIAAVDRNYVNWVRGGNFNPSGQVRVPSVRGDGTGFFGTGVVRTFDVTTFGSAAACVEGEGG